MSEQEYDFDGPPPPVIIDRFRGEYAFLSNFYKHEFEYGGVKWKSAEAPFQASKTRDVEQQKAIRDAETPQEAKRLGRICALRDDWEEVKDAVMLDIIRAKFHDGGWLSVKLMGTGEAMLLEGNNWGDRYWGVCDGEGLNKLGEILMYVRAERQMQLPF